MPIVSRVAGVARCALRIGEAPMSFDPDIAIRYVALGFLLIFLFALLRLLFGEWHNPNFRTLVFQYFRVVIGLPAAGVFAFLIVALFQSTTGPIKVDMIGFKFEGAAGPIVMWIITLLAITISITALWKKTDL
jgi:hypothetical protein